MKITITNQSRQHAEIHYRVPSNVERIIRSHAPMNGGEAVIVVPDDTKDTEGHAALIAKQIDEQCRVLGLKYREG
jgi:hypothetical protein